MSFTRANPPGWAVGDPLTSAQQNALDIDHANAVDKTSAGDTINGPLTIASPLGAIILTSAVPAALVKSSDGNAFFGFSGLTLGTGKSLTLAGGATIAAAPIVVTLPMNGASVLSTVAGSTASISLGNGPTDIKLGPTVSRSMTFSCNPLMVSSSTSTDWTTGQGGAFGYPMISKGTSGVQFYRELPLHDGATLSSLSLYMVPASTHAGLPSTPPSFEIKRVTIATGAIVSLSASGPKVFATGTLANWNSAGLLNDTFTANQNAVIDRSQYLYVAVVTDESSTNSIVGAAYYHFKVTHSAIGDMRFP